MAAQLIPTPTLPTLRKYGLPLEAWQAMLVAQGGVCAICRKVPGGSGRLYIDHEHVRGWKKMPPELRRGYVRGLLCYLCNTVWVRRGATPERLRSAADYLQRYEERRLASSPETV